VSASLATAVAVAARRALRHPVSFAACAIVIPAVTAVIALALPSYYVADASLTLRLPSLGPETVRLLRLDPFTVTEGPRYRDPLLSDQPDADQVIARLAADRLQDTSAAEVADKVDVTSEAGAAATLAGKITINVRARADRPRSAAQLANAYAAALVSYREVSFANDARGAQRVDSLLTALRGRRLSDTQRRASARLRAQRKVLMALEPSNLRIRTRATPPNGPRSPRPWRDFRVAAVLGLLLWLTVVALSSRRARQLRDDSSHERDARNLRITAASGGSQVSS